MERWHMYRSNPGGMAWEDWKTMMESLGKEVVVYGYFYGGLDESVWEQEMDDDEVPFIENWYSLTED